MSKILLVTTHKDISRRLFFDKNTSLVEPTALTYSTPHEELQKIFQQDFDFIYFRDPFNDDSLRLKIAQTTTSKILSRYPHAYKVDRILSYEDMLFEDKWNQYKIFSRLMPQTNLLKSIDQIDSSFVKKRVSARSKGVILTREDYPIGDNFEDYLVQPKLKIKEEYRVNIVGGRIALPIAIKTSKSNQGATRLIGKLDSTPSEIREIADTVYGATLFDLAGLDIAKTPEGYKLIEVNRSPQFRGYYRITSVNLAILLFEHLQAQNS
jgi:hypothetical protein